MEYNGGTSRLNKLDIIHQLSVLKDVDYHNTLLLTSLIELLENKGILLKEDVSRKAATLDLITEIEINAAKK